jgi:hypothetical protein
MSSVSFRQAGSFLVLLIASSTGVSQPPTASQGPALLPILPTADFPLTGQGSAAAWHRTEWLVLSPSEGHVPALETKVKFLYSDSGLYCLYSCEDIRITATLKSDFADLYREDVVELFLWPDETRDLYFEYELSPDNYELALLVPNRGGDFFGWMPWHYEGRRKVQHRTHLVPSGDKLRWTAEFFIPFALLKPLGNVPAHPGTRWRANFYRIDYDQGAAEWSWQPTVKTFHEFEKFGTLVFE